MKHLLSFGKKPHGRPPVVDLSDDDLRQIQSYYLPTNRNKKEGSILLAWVRFCESRDELNHLVSDHMPETTIPSAVTEACRQARAAVGAHRGGERRLRHESAYVPGTMRRHHSMQRRLVAGERASIDDATRNVACWISWPWGGCPCSDKYGVRLGRWQTLIVHDDASSYVPVVSSVFRWHQSYRATDAAAAIFETERDVLMFDHWSIEGGVWQTRRVLDILGGRFISAKGRPNQKLVENYIGRLWDIMAGQPGDVGRHRAEILRNSDLYIKAREGRVDPRDHFLSLSQGQSALYESVDYLNEKRLQSRTYGTWVPKDRWQADLEEYPRATRPDADDFLILPVAETRTVSNDSISITEDGPMGVRMKWIFTADWLAAYRGRKVTAYFDPKSEWPVSAVICLQGKRQPLGSAVCINPVGESKDHAIEIVKSVRQTVLTETRILSKMHQERITRTLRHPSGVAISDVSPPSPPSDAAVRAPLPPDFSSDLMPVDRVLHPLRDHSATTPRITRDDLAGSLSRRAARFGDDAEILA